MHNLVQKYYYPMFLTGAVMSINKQNILHFLGNTFWVAYNAD